MTTRPLHMLALLVVAWLAIIGLSRPAMAAPHLAAQLVAENPAPSPGSTTTLAIALAPEPGPSLFDALSPWPGLDHHLLDITDRGALDAAVHQARAAIGRAHGLGGLSATVDWPLP